MARTIRKEIRRPYSHEGTVAREMTRRDRRSKAKQALQAAKQDNDYDNMVLPVDHGTEGWMTY